jgi:tetratricopeptide (TPR) repeat protein
VEATLGKINRAKVIEKAHKFLQRGDIRKAIKEYERLLRDDPSDIRTKLKVADLLLRIGERDGALAGFDDVARFYESQGFLLKAVAVYKQMQKLRPDDIQVRLSLANLYHKIGLLPDALSNYKAALSLQAKAGLVLERLQTWKNMMELDPDNVKLHVALAEEFAKEGMIADAVDEFRAAARCLKKAGGVEEYIKVAERLLYHKPDDFEISKDLASLYMAQGDTLKALSRLQVCFRANPDDIEVLDMLSQVFEQSGQTQKAVAVLKSLAKRYDDTGLLKERDEVYKRVLKLQPGDSSAREALRFEPEVVVLPQEELEFEPTFREEAGKEEELVPEEEFEVEEMEETTNPEFKVVEPEEVKEVKEESQPVAMDEFQIDRTLVDKNLPFEPDLTPSPISVDIMLVPEEYQDDIKNLEFLIDTGLMDEARDLLEELKQKAPDLAILAQYEALIGK